MKTSANAFRDDRPTAGAPAAARSAVAPLAPLLAGARARGVADGLELIGAAAALLDEQGEVLHLNARALEPAWRPSRPRRRTPAGARPRPRPDPRRRRSIRPCATRSPRASRWATTRAATASESRIMPVTAEADDSFQLLRAVAILEPRGAAARAASPG